MSDKVVSYLRTAVPVAWGSLLGWLLTQFPGLPEGLSSWLQGQTEVVVALSIFVWYAIWRWLEPRVPDNISKFLLGSSKVPVYLAPDEAVVAVEDHSNHVHVRPSALQDRIDAGLADPISDQEREIASRIRHDDGLR